MARPREFDENTVLDAAMDRFWLHGFQATSVRDLTDGMGITVASLYNAFGDKRGLLLAALRRYMEVYFDDSLAGLESAHPPRKAIRVFFRDLIEVALNDRQRRGCLLVNMSLEVPLEDEELRDHISAMMLRVQAFFRRNLKAAQASGEIRPAESVEDLSRMLLGIWVAIRVLGRTRPSRALLEGLLRPALSLLDDSPLMINGTN